MNVESKVSERYAEGAKEVQPSLCCPVDYDASLLEILPQEIIDKDYGCGDPSRYVREGDVVLDLGSGGGKICYMAAQLVGEKGHVIGVDMTDEMLALARQYQAEMAERIGNDRVSFRKGYIQDLALDLDAMENYLQEHPLKTLEDFQAFESWQANQKQQSPLVENNSVDLVVSNCVLNLVAEQHRQQLIAEVFRVLRPGGRVAISDIVSDEQVPQHLKDDDHLWSGCISGAFHEEAFIQAFLDAGFEQVAFDKWDEKPWQIVEDIEFRSVTITAMKPFTDSNDDAGQAVMYLGPFAAVKDDSGNVYPRGQRIAVGQRIFKAISNGVLAEQFVCIEPEVLRKSCCPPTPGTIRPAIETRGGSQSVESDKSGSGCC